MMPDQVEVHLQLPDGDEVQVGTLSNDGATRAPHGLMTFSYSEGYLSDPRAYPLSPELPLTRGPLRTVSGRPNIGALGDALPDSWGRRVIRATRPDVLDDYGLLVHVNDQTRQGAIRLRTGDAYLSTPSNPLAGLLDLPSILEAALRFDAGAETDDDLHALVLAGTSVGGARPKAVVQVGGALAIAKFPRAEEYSDPMAWEATCLALASGAGIVVPAFQLERITDGRSVLVTTRFDRVDARRVGYLSADSMLVKAEADTIDYVTLAAIVAESSADPDTDTESLFRRICLNLLINNVDDHMRNHGFLRVANGWSLSPVFDLEPQRAYGRVAGTPLTPGGDEVQRDIRELVATHAAFRLSHDHAARVVREVEHATANWRTVAVSQFGISPEAAEAMRHAFDNPNRDRARRLGG